MKLTQKQQEAMQLFAQFDEVMCGQCSADGKVVNGTTLRSLQKRGLLEAEHRQDPFGHWNWHYTITDAGRDCIENLIMADLKFAENILIRAGYNPTEVGRRMAARVKEISERHSEKSDKSYQDGLEEIARKTIVELVLRSEA